jgi:hypothetical protein
MTGLGFNVHMSYCTDEYWSQLLDRFKRTKPPVILLLDSLHSEKEVHRTLEAIAALPNTTIIYRKFFGDNTQSSMSTDQWVREHAVFAGKRVYCSANNEPNWRGSLLWHENVVSAAYAANIKVSVGGFSVGTPHEDDIHLGRGLLQLMARIGHQHCILDLHEYTRALWTVDFARDAKPPLSWPSSVPDTQPLWLMGRFRRILQYCRDNSIRPPRIVIGEWGFDRVRDVPPDVYGDTEGLYSCAPVWGSWNVGEWQAYAAAQLKAAWKAIYKRHPEIIGVCFYCLSDRSSGWEQFNAYYADTFMQLTETGFDTVTTPPATQPFTPYALGRYRLIGTSNNIRSEPSVTNSIIRKTVQNGDIIKIISTAATSNGIYQWQQVAQGELTGWMAVWPASIFKAERLPDEPSYVKDELKAIETQLVDALTRVRHVLSQL